MLVRRFPSTRPVGIVVHGLHKSGTMFLYQLFRRLAKAKGIAYYSGNHEVPNDHWVTPEIDHDFCYCPIRTFADGPVTFTERQHIRRIFQIRDPRDILVSQYYSYGWRHTEQGFNPGRHRQRASIRSMPIDDYVLDKKLALSPLRKRLKDLLDRDLGPADRMVQYEMMVTAFPDWLEQVLTVFDFRFPSLMKARFAFRYRNEFRPDTNPDSHKRSVLPGDFRRRLSPSTIRQLNEALRTELQFLGYAEGESEGDSAPGKPPGTDRQAA